MTSWHDYPAAIIGSTERPLLRWFSERVHPGDTWLDVGAHYGYTALHLCHLVGPAGRVFAFEPMLRTAGSISETRRLNSLHQLTVVPIALAAPGSVQLMRLPTTRGMADSTLATSAWTETLLVTSLDWLWQQIAGNDECVHGVKIDVQGMEVETLRGMVGILKRWHPILAIELHEGVQRPQILDLLEHAGYSRRGLPIEPLPGEVDALYVNDRSYVFEHR